MPANVLISDIFFTIFVNRPEPLRIFLQSYQRVCGIFMAIRFWFSRFYKNYDAESLILRCRIYDFFDP